MPSPLVGARDSRPACRSRIPAGRLGPVVLLAALVVSMALATACSDNGAKGNMAAANMMAMAVPVTVATANEKTVPVEVRVIGNVEAYSTVTIRSQLDGKIDSVHFQEGQETKAGDLLFTLDSRPYVARLQQAEANLARDIAQARNAAAQVDRYAKLFQAGIISKDQYDTFRTNSEALEASVKADQAAVESAKVDLSYCTIHAPIAGRTGNLMVHPGNEVKANDTSLVVINQITPAYVDFSVPEQHLADVKRYMARGKVAVRATISQDPLHPEDGVLTFVNNTVDTTTGTILLKGTFANSDRRLWPGQFVNVVLTLTAQANAVVVPSQAVQSGQAGQYVFLVKSDMTVEMRPVSPGMVYSGETVIEKGLAPGDKVVTDGQLRLFPGAKVQVKNAP
ncbi:MAG TPA: efflux RND transporter periplasmic adaptor subunit [Terriglobia bacterium]|nr:efflux RND transporter periplasmic adaptor subunit [Terriglobia bacterium]